jgi:hypothetical protein
VTVTVENDLGITGDASARFPVFFSSLGDDDGPVIGPSPTTIPLRIG